MAYGDPYDARWPPVTIQPIDFAERVEAERRKKHPGPVLDPRDPMAIARELAANTFTNLAGERFLVRHRGSFHRFTGSYYAVADDEMIRAATWEFLETARRPGSNGAIEHFKPTKARVGDVIDALAAVTAIDSAIEPPAWLKHDEDCLPAAHFMAVANGLLHLPTGDLYEPTANYFGLCAAEVEFDAGAPEPLRWLKFLGDLFADDGEAIDVLQDWMGYLLSPDTRQQKILLVVGPKRSGKGTLARIITSLLGRDSVAAPTLASLSSNFGIEPLIGKPLAIISDARLGSRSDQAAISERLLSISGEDSLTIDRKFRTAWTGRLSTRFMILTNELPRITDASGALTGRFIILVLKNSFYGREDAALTDRLLIELPGILNWALVGYRRIRQRGHFLQPGSAQETLEALETLSSPITAFVREKCRTGPTCFTSVAEIYRHWRDWCADNGRREPGTIQSFGRDLSAAFPAIKQRRAREDGERLRVYDGIEVWT